jgi:hypothetical protein
MNDQGVLAEALQVRFTAVLADGQVIRFETGRPAEASVVFAEREPGEIPLSALPEVPHGTRLAGVHLLIRQGDPYTLVFYTPHPQGAVTWNPQVAFEQWAHRYPLPQPEAAPSVMVRSTDLREAIAGGVRICLAKWTKTEGTPWQEAEPAALAEFIALRMAPSIAQVADTHTMRVQQQEQVMMAEQAQTAFLAGVAAFIDSITEPPDDDNQFLFTLCTADGGRYVQTTDQRGLARALVGMVQAPHVIEPGDRYVIERAGDPAPEQLEQRAETLAAALQRMLADLGVDAGDDTVREVVANRLREAARSRVQDIT